MGSLCDLDLACLQTTKKLAFRILYFRVSVLLIHLTAFSTFSWPMYVHKYGLKPIFSTFFKMEGRFNWPDVANTGCWSQVVPGCLLGREHSVQQINHLTLKALKYFYITYGDQRFFSIWNHHKCLSQLIPLYLNTYVMGQYKYPNYFSARTVFGRQNLTSIDVRFIKWVRNTHRSES